MKPTGMCQRGFHSLKKWSGKALWGVFLLGAGALTAQPLTSTWVAQIQGASEDWGRAVALDASGQTVVAGSYFGSITLGDGEANETVLSTAPSDAHAYVARYQTNGALASAFQIRLSNLIQVKAAVFDASLNLYLTGHYLNGAVFGYGQAQQTTLSAVGDRDAFVAKYNAAGQLVWVRSLGGSHADQGLSVAVNAAGSVAVAGELGQADGGTHQFMAVYNASGVRSLLDDQAPDSGFTDRSGAKVALGDDGLVTVISHQSTDGALVSNDTSTLQRYDSTGSVDWSLVLDGGLPGALVLASDGIVAVSRYVASYTAGSTPPEDMVVQKVDMDGNALWSEIADGPGVDRPMDCVVDEDGQIFVAGGFQSSITFGAGLDSETTFTGTGERNPFIAKYSADGDFYWAQHVGDNNGSGLYHLAVRDDRAVLIGGFYETVTLEGHDLTSQGYSDVFVANFTGLADPLISGVAFFYPSLVMMEGVTLTFSGLGTTETNFEGYYEMAVPEGWSGTVTPSMTGYDFGGQQYSYTHVTSNTGTQDFWLLQDAVAAISGKVAFSPSDVPMEGVTLTFSNDGGTAVTDSLGHYTLDLPYKWSGTVTASLDGFEFTPATRTFEPLLHSWTGQNFSVAGEAEVNISGRAYFVPSGDGIADAVISATGVETTAVTDSQGVFTLTVPYRYTGELSAAKPGHVFDPVSHAFDALITHVADQDFEVSGQPMLSITGRLLSVSGHGIPNAGVVYDETSTVLTDANGDYLVEVPYAWSGTVAPADTNALYEPASRTYETLSDNMTDQDFQSQGLIRVSISGTVSDGAGVAVQGAVLSYADTLSVETDAQGDYALTVPNGWSGTVTVEKEGFIFYPASRTYAEVDTHQVAQNYTQLGPTIVQISGHVLDQSGVGMADVAMVYGADSDTVKTDEQGAYLIQVPFDWSGTVTAIKEGHEFTPASRSYDHLRAHRVDQNYNLAGTPMFHISGAVALHSGGAAAGVMLIIGDHVDTVYTDTQGAYTLDVPIGWNGDITPQYEDWVFSPVSRSYEAVESHQTGQDYTAMGPAQLTVSGRVYFQPGGEGIADVIVRWGVEGDSVLTDADGLYSITVANGWSGTVTPSKLNHVIDPTGRTFTALHDHQVNQDFWVMGKPTLTIAGQVTDRAGQAVAGVALVYGTADSVLTATNGSYAIAVPYGWSGTVLARKGLELFDPASRSYTILKADVAGANYTDLGPESVQISGRIYYHPSNSPVQGAQLDWGVEGDSVLTDANGNYTITVANDWSGAVIPQKVGHEFEPSFRPYSNLTDHVAGQDFWVNAPATLTIAGRVMTASGEGQADVVVCYGETDSVLTDEEGDYLITVPYGWSGTVGTRCADWAMSPTSRDYTVLTASQTNQNFQILGPALVTISGSILDTEGQGAADVQVFLGLNRDSLMTGTDGAYAFTVPFGWTGAVRPQKEGMAFSPAQRSYAAVDTHQVNQDFTIFVNTAPRCLIVSTVAQPGLVSILNELQYYYHTYPDLPIDLATYDLVIYADSAAARNGHLPVLPSFISGGGSVIFMDETPSKLAGTEGDLSGMASWFVASTLTRVHSGQAMALVDQPLGTGLLTGDVLVTSLTADSAAALSGAVADAILLGTWEGSEPLWQSVVRVHGSGKLGYWSRLETGNAAAVTLFKAMIEWAVNEDTAVEDDPCCDPSVMPQAFALLPAYPNPFNPSTTLSYKLAESAPVRLVIYDLSGRKVMTFDEGFKPAGTHQVVWHACDESGSGVASGMYIVRITAGKKVAHQKLIFLK